MKGLDVYDFEKAQDKENLMADIKAGKNLTGLQRQAFSDQQNQVCSRFNICVQFRVVGIFISNKNVVLFES